MKKMPGIFMAFAAVLAPAFAQGQSATEATNYWGSINFESYTNVPVVGVSGKNDDGAPVSGVTSRWLATTDEDSSTVTAYNGSGVTAPTNNRPDKYKGDSSNNNYLKLSTESATLWRYFNPVQVNGTDGNVSTNGGAAVDIQGDIFVDQMVQFTVSEEVGEAGPPSLDGDAKLAIWLEKKDVENGTSTTNLMVKGSFVSCQDGSDLCTTQQIYTLSGTVNPGEWYRLTVRAIRNVIDSRVSGVYLPGFVIYLNGTALTSTVEVATSEAKDICTNILEELNCCLVKSDCMAMINAKTLIPSIVGYNQQETSSLSAVGYQGTGALDDLVMTDILPAFLKDVSPVVPGKTEIEPGQQSESYTSKEQAEAAIANMTIKVSDAEAAAAGQASLLKLAVVQTSGTGEGGTSGWCVEVQIDTNHVVAVDTTLAKVAESMESLISASPNSIQVDASSCTKGLYYSIGAMAELGGEITEGPRVLAKEGGVTLSAVKPAGATDKCFFKVLINMTGNNGGAATP